MRRVSVSCLLIAASVLPAAAPAQTYPTAPVNLVVTTPPGGSIDAVARLIATDLRNTLGQPIIVVNRGGAGGNIAADAVAKAAPDGHTLLMTASSTLTMNRYIYESLSFDPEKSFAAVTSPARNNNILVVHPKLNVSTLDEFIKLLKAQPGKLNYASAGNGSFSHFALVLFSIQTGTEAGHIPFSGIAPAMTAVLAGQVDYMFDSATSIPHIRAGKLKALAVKGPRRLPALPEVATLRELGLPEMEGARSYYAILAPAGTPANVVQRLNRDIVQIVKQPAVAEKVVAMGLEVAGTSSEELAANLRDDLARYGVLARRADLKRN
jgi:tripartite-type tricarboxylate transporter receptor subunit TctC